MELYHCSVFDRLRLTIYILELGTLFRLWLAQAFWYLFSVSVFLFSFSTVYIVRLPARTNLKNDYKKSKEKLLKCKLLIYTLF